MTDVHTPAQRSFNMSRVKGKNTKPELLVRSLLHFMGYRFRLHRKNLPGKPDIVLPRYKTVIFVHGCFWHQHEGCPKATVPATNREFWVKKLQSAIDRDIQNRVKLEALGWRVVTVWECETKDIQALAFRLKKILPK